MEPNHQQEELEATAEVEQAQAAVAEVENPAANNEQAALEQATDQWFGPHTCTHNLQPRIAPNQHIYAQGHAQVAVTAHYGL